MCDCNSWKISVIFVKYLYLFPMNNYRTKRVLDYRSSIPYNQAKLLNPGNAFNNHFTIIIIDCYANYMKRIIFWVKSKWLITSFTGNLEKINTWCYCEIIFLQKVLLMKYASFLVNLTTKKYFYLLLFEVELNFPTSACHTVWKIFKCSWKK